MNSKEEFTIQMKTKVAEIEEILKRYLPEAEGYQKVIMEAMEYSLMAGGKRLRPLCSLWSLCLSCCCVLCRRALCRTAVICLHLFSLSGILTVSAGSSSFITAVLCILRTEYMHDILFLWCF